MEVRHTVRISWCPLRLVVMALVVVRVTVLSTGRLRYIWDDLHAAWNNTGRSTTTSRIGRCCRSSKSLSQLFYQCLANVISSNVNRISYTKND